MKIRAALAVGVALTAISTPAFAQETGPVDAEPVLEEDEIVVTAVARGQNRLESSVSVSSLDGESIADLNPRSAADLLRQLPGVRSEASGGDGNANIAVRGLPVSTGGARYVQLQEDGLPVLEFGDIVFGNADNFLRADRNVGRVEAVRGGSASTFASNAPGGVINFISRTGRDEGGAVAVSAGLDHQTYRVDFNYGGSVGDSEYFHAGGYYRRGEGVRDIGYEGFDGGQIKANYTKEFAGGGYIRVYGKLLKDKTATFLPNPVLVTGTGSDPTYTSLPNFDIGKDSVHSEYWTNPTTLNGLNRVETFDFRDGLEVESIATGVEFEFDLSDNLTLTNRARVANNSGGFLSPFPASAGSAQSVADGVGGPGSTLVFASGPDQGNIVTNPSALGGNGIVTSIVMFNTRLNSLQHAANDLRLTGDFDLGGSRATFTGGFYASHQEVDTDWLWTSHLQTTQGDGEAVLLDVRNAAGDLVTQGGTVGFGASFFGNCCRRNYDVEYNTYAPFAALSLELGAITLDGSIRYDFGTANGTIAGSDTGLANGLFPYDFDGSSTIDNAEAQTSFIPLVNAPVDYDFDYLSYSIGANYLLSDSFSVFGRYSKGGRHVADRALFTSNVSVIDGSLPAEEGIIATVKQAEGGLKYQNGPANFYATVFYAETAETNVEIAPLAVIEREFEALGVELEGSYRVGPFSLSGGVTWTDAEIVSDSNAAIIGNTPRRQADVTYQGTAQYEADLFTVGANVVGTTDSFTQDNNDLILPAYTQVNAFLAFRPIRDVEFSLNANNVFDTLGFTEAEEGSIPGNNIVRARSIAGRSIVGSVRVDF